MDPNFRSGLIQYIFAMLLSGTIGIFVTEAHQEASNVVFFRCLIGGLSILIFCLAKGLFKGVRYTPKKFLLTLLGGICIVYNWVLFFKAFTMTSITVTTVVYHVQPFILVLLGWLILKERPAPNKLGWMVVAFLGIVLVAGYKEMEFGRTNRYLTGIGLAILASVLYSLTTIIVKQLKEYPPHVTVFIQMMVGTFAVLPMTSLQSFSPSLKEGAFLGALGIFNTCIMYVLIYSAFQKLKTSTIALLTFIYPAVAVLSDIVFYGRRLSADQWAGMGLILFANFASARGWSIGPKKVRPSVTPS